MRVFLSFPALTWLQCLTLICAAVASTRSVQAATLIVTTTADSGQGSLRDTIAAASDGDTIQFDTMLNGQIITLTGAELVIDKDITISGPGPSMLAVSRGSNGRPAATRGLVATRPNMFAVLRAPEGTQFRIFHVMPGHTIGIEGLTISGVYNGGIGGGILNEQATLTVNSCIVEDNEASSGAGIYSYGASAILTITNSTISGNLALGEDGGGIYNNAGTLTISNSTVSSNMAPSSPLANGGGIF